MTEQLIDAMRMRNDLRGLLDASDAMRKYARNLGVEMLDASTIRVRTSREFCQLASACEAKIIDSQQDFRRIKEFSVRGVRFVYFGQYVSDHKTEFNVGSNIYVNKHKKFGRF